MRYNRTPEIQDKVKYLKRYMDTLIHRDCLIRIIEDLQSRKDITNDAWDWIISTYSDYDDIKKLDENYKIETSRLIKLYKQEKLKALKDMSKIKRYIETLKDPEERNLLTYKYIIGYQQEQLCLAMNMSRATLYRAQKRALENLMSPEEFELSIKYNN